MRQKMRECTEQGFIDEVMNQAEEVFVGFSREGGPYVLPFHFVWLDGSMYIHCALKGEKLDLARRNPEVGFSLITDVLVDGERATTYYKSLSGRGLAVSVEDQEEKQRALAALARRYNARCVVPTPEPALRKVGVLRIDVTAVTGKRNVPPADFRPGGPAEKK